MRNDERFEIERAFDLLPHVVGASWTAVWFRMQGIRKLWLNFTFKLL